MFDQKVSTRKDCVNLRPLGNLTFSVTLTKPIIPTLVNFKYTKYQKFMLKSILGLQGRHQKFKLTIF